MMKNRKISSLFVLLLIQLIVVNLSLDKVSRGQPVVESRECLLRIVSSSEPAFCTYEITSSGYPFVASRTYVELQTTSKANSSYVYRKAPIKEYVFGSTLLGVNLNDTFSNSANRQVFSVNNLFLVGIECLAFVLFKLVSQLRKRTF